MPLINLLNTPKTQEELDVWSFSHKDSHVRILQRINTVTGIKLTEYNIDPLPKFAIPTWLQWNQQYHTDMNQVLGVEGSDLETVDFSNPQQFQNWIYIHFLEHQTAEQELGI